MALSASLEGLTGFDATSTVGELETAVDGARDAATTMEESLRGLVEAQIATLETALEDLQGYRDSLEDDQTIEEVVEGAGASIAAVVSARAEVDVPTVRWSPVRRPPRRRRTSSRLRTVRSTRPAPRGAGLVSSPAPRAWPRHRRA